MLNITALALSNVSNLESNFKALLESHEADKRTIIDEFVGWIATSCFVTINVKLFVLVDLISGSRLLNTFELAEVDSRAFSMSKDAALRRNLGSFYDRRMAFTAAFEDGEKFYYGALTPGQGGLRAYDPYCLQLKNEVLEAASVLAYLPGDSLRICFTSAGNLDTHAGCAGISPHSHRHIMGAIAFAPRAIVTSRTDWPKILTSAPEYIEAIFVADVALSSIERVQILKAEYDRLLSIVPTSMATRLQRRYGRLSANTGDD